jgi:hypothetical protein
MIPTRAAVAPNKIGVQSVPNLMQVFDPQGNDISEGATTNGSGNWADIISSIFNGAGNIFNTIGSNPLTRFGMAQYASGRAADEMNEQAGRYESLGREAADRADPFGRQGGREWAYGQLQDIMKDPTKSPIYQGMRDEVMKSLGPQMAAGGLAGGGSAANDWLQALGDVNAKYTGQMMDRFGRWAGGDFNPASSGQMLIEGGRLAGDARAQALAARLYPLGMLSGQGGPGGGGPGGGAPGGTSGGIGSVLSQIARAIGGGGPNGSSNFNPQSLLRAISSLPLSSLPPELFQTLGQIPNGISGLFSGLNPDQLRSVFGNGYEDYVTQNVPGFANGTYNPSVFGPGLNTGFGQFGGPFAPLGEGGFGNPFEGFGDFGLGDGSWDWSQVFGDDFWTTGFGGDMGLEDISSFFDF